MVVSFIFQHYKVQKLYVYELITIMPVLSFLSV
jgi:hypothetical protein